MLNITHTPLSHRVTLLPATTTKSLPLICRHHHLLPTMHLSSATKAIVAPCLLTGGPPLAFAFIASCPPPDPSLIYLCRLSSPLVCHRCPISWLIVRSDHWSLPLICRWVGHLLPTLPLPLVHRRCPLSSVVAASRLLSSAAVAPISWLIVIS